MTGLPDAYLVEIEFQAGVWTDVTSRVRVSDGIQVSYGRATEFDEINASTLRLTLDSFDGEFVPDSAVSPHYPHVTEGVQIRVTVTRSAVDYQVFTGFVTAWEPSWPTALQSALRVAVTATDALGVLQRHTFADGDVPTSAPGFTEAHTATWARLQSYVPEVTSWATAGGEVRTIGDPTWTGRTALEVARQIARTINGVVFCTGDGAVTLYAADACRAAVPAVTIDAETDLDLGVAVPTLRRSSDSAPTRVTITYAGGATTTLISPTETVRREATLDTCAADLTGAELAGSYLLDAYSGLRVSSIGVDLATAGTDLWSALLGLYPTQRIKVGGFDASLLGVSSYEMYVQGWSLTLLPDAVRVALECSPAGQFVSAAWDAGDEYGRWAWGTGAATVTSGTAVGTTSVGTMVITTSAGPTLTTDAGAYPLYLDWNGEAVRIDSPPGGSTSPQTVTIAARAQLNTGAQTHLAGEPVEVWHSAVWGF